MKPYLIIGISLENELFVSSIQHELEDPYDEITAQKIIEEHMEVKVDRVLIVDESSGDIAPAAVVNDFNASDYEDEDYDEEDED